MDSDDFFKITITATIGLVVVTLILSIGANSLVSNACKKTSNFSQTYRSK